MIAVFSLGRRTRTRRGVHSGAPDLTPAHDVAKNHVADRHCCNYINACRLIANMNILFFGTITCSLEAVEYGLPCNDIEPGIASHEESEHTLVRRAASLNVITAIVTLI